MAIQFCAVVRSLHFQAEPWVTVLGNTKAEQSDGKCHRKDTAGEMQIDECRDSSVLPASFILHFFSKGEKVR